jgi:hypothetical protein
MLWRGSSNDRNLAGPAHFFAVAARLMRRILVDYARARGYAKRGGDNRENCRAGQNVHMVEKGCAIAALL